ncbi:hypothetical protein Thi970DRAFT_00813 [Thiorhodovibrio frisius]|uniref:Uncharacterized protein n=1 Tax=Thiorhodovibrio frisius TaxID=631362 RepID=H8YXI4_9GAMM|nr:hypothetical protein Thi970DRAFT_00813 [Thiorhodovibrio frisius]WPL22569.1 hypothetical protein Thiofri_02736 [Thiorhodovibrio frisius]
MDLGDFLAGTADEIDLNSGQKKILISFWGPRMSTLESLKETVKRELPAWLESDPAFREAILALTNHRYSPRAETNDWFHQTLEEMRRVEVLNVCEYDDDGEYVPVVRQYARKLTCSCIPRRSKPPR